MMESERYFTQNRDHQGCYFHVLDTPDDPGSRWNKLLGFQYLVFWCILSESGTFAGIYKIK